MRAITTTPRATIIGVPGQNKFHHHCFDFSILALIVPIGKHSHEYTPSYLEISELSLGAPSKKLWPKMGFCLSRRDLPLKLGREKTNSPKTPLMCLLRFCFFFKNFPRKKAWIAKYKIPNIARIFSCVRRHGCCILAPGMRENEERMRKWREIHSLHFLIFSLFPPSLSTSYINNSKVDSQMR